MVWKTVILLLSATLGSAFVAHDRPEENLTCSEHVLDSSRQPLESLAGIRFQLRHNGLPLDVAVCVFDEDGVKVAEAVGEVSDVEIFSKRFGLLPGKYRAVTNVSPTEGGGAAGATHSADLLVCRAGAFVAPTSTHRTPSGGFGIMATLGYCMPVDGLAAGVLDVGDGEVSIS